jgi:predicted NUDIX family NTP pyrophosphohydrolase
MSKRSAGLMMYRVRDGEMNVFLVHPGGPYWSKKNEGSWTIPKGEYEADKKKRPGSRYPSRYWNLGR